MAANYSRFSGSAFIVRESPFGFGLRFRVNPDQSVEATVTFDEYKQGALGIAHGGAVAAVLDEAMGCVCYEHGKPGYTVTMTYDYKAHVPLGVPVRLRAWVERSENRKVFTACEARLPDDTVAVVGRGVFVFSQALKDMLDNSPYDGQSETHL